MNTVWNAILGESPGDRLGIAPLAVSRDDQVKGLPRIFCLAVRLFTLMEFVARRSRSEQKRAIAGLYLDSPVKTTAQPTRRSPLAGLFARSALIAIAFPDRKVYQVQGLSPVQDRDS
jgi:transposase